MSASTSPVQRGAEEGEGRAPDDSNRGLRDFILLYVNGIEHRVRGSAALAPLSTFLRKELGLVGTKLVCSEGDCGACSVLVGRPVEGRLNYEVVNSCIFFVHQADCAHVVTVEGLKEGPALSSVQRAIVEGHGIQCGFCTPGFAVAMTAMFDRSVPERNDPFSREELQRGLCGNLCRCTGYLQLLEAGASISPGEVSALSDRYPDAEFVPAMTASAGDAVRVEAGRSRILHLPNSIEACVALRGARADAVLLGGATDLGVECNLGRRAPEFVIGLSKIPDLSEVSVTDGQAVLGARATWTQIASALKESLPECREILELFGSPQIRNVGTLGGNLANASPIGDFAPLLLVLGAEIELAGPQGLRLVDIADFHLGYKQTAIGAAELITKVIFPLPAQGAALRVYKVSKRRHFDLAIVNAAILVAREGARIVDFRIALGGVGPVGHRLPNTESFLRGKPFALETFRGAGPTLRGEIRPISDVRGSAALRLQLAENLLSKFYHEVTGAGSPRAEAG
jgi:xanthine dehydrogenase small subunit